MENQTKKLRLDEFKLESFVTSVTIDARTVKGLTAIKNQHIPNLITVDS